MTNRDFTLTINGTPTTGDNWLDVIDPATATVFARCPLATPTHLDAAVAAARAAFPAWAATPVDERAAKLLAFGDALQAHREELGALLSREQGKTVKSAIGEISGAIYWINETAGLRPTTETITGADGATITLRRQPLGVVGSITPWNFPVMIAIWHIIPAMLAGNSVIIKPSPNTPLTTLRLVEIANGILPHGVLNSLTGDVEIGSGMARHAGIDKLVFTGSTPTGKAIMRDGAGNLKRLTLELGGNDAAIVLPDADVDAIAQRLFAASFGNSGQICAAVKRLYVHESVHDALAGKLAALAQAATVGAGDDPASQFGPLQNKKQFDYVRALADDARAQGGRFLSGGTAADGEGYFFPLSVLVDVTDGMRIVDEEQFGPVLPIIRYSDPEDALRRANSSDNGLGGSIWSTDIAAAAAMAERLATGTAWVNDHATISPLVPFGGAKQSGIGVEFGKHGLDEFTQLQTLRTPAA